jgi:hypothetical protein
MALGGKLFLERWQFLEYRELTKLQCSSYTTDIPIELFPIMIYFASFALDFFLILGFLYN